MAAVCISPKTDVFHQASRTWLYWFTWELCLKTNNDAHVGHKLSRNKWRARGRSLHPSTVLGTCHLLQPSGDLFVYIGSPRNREQVCKSEESRPAYLLFSSSSTDTRRATRRRQTAERRPGRWVLWPIWGATDPALERKWTAELVRVEPPTATYPLLLHDQTSHPDFALNQNLRGMKPNQTRGTPGGRRQDCVYGRLWSWESVLVRN